MGDLKVKYQKMGKMLNNHFTKPLQGTDFHKLRSEIQGIPEDTLDTDLGWDIPDNKFIPITQDCVERSDVNTDNRNKYSWEGSTVENKKTRESNTVVRTVEGSPAVISKSREINHAVRTVSYDKIMRRNILLS